MQFTRRPFKGIKAPYLPSQYRVDYHDPMLCILRNKLMSFKMSFSIFIRPSFFTRYSPFPTQFIFIEITIFRSKNCQLKLLFPVLYKYAPLRCLLNVVSLKVNFCEYYLSFISNNLLLQNGDMSAFSILNILYC